MRRGATMRAWLALVMLGGTALPSLSALDTASLAGPSEAPAAEKKAARGSGRRSGASALRRALQKDRAVKKLTLEDGWLRPGCEEHMFAAGAKNTVRIARKVVDYTAKRLEVSEVPRMPFEHMYVTEVFEPAFYQCIMGHKLSGTEKLAGLTKLTGGSSKRYTIPILRETGGPPADRAKELGIFKPFWDAFVAAFGSQRMNHILLGKFQRTIEKRFAPAKLPGPWQGDDFYIMTPEGKRWAADFLYEMDLSRDVPGYSISPHTDTRHKLVTTLFYLCNTTAWPEAGTQFLVSSEGKESAHGSGRVKWDDTMQVAKQVTYVPNAMVAFAPCFASWHAVQELKEGVTRDTIQGFVHFSKARKQLHVRESMLGKQACAP